MDMRRPLLAAGALVATLAIGALAAPRAQAEPLLTLNDFFVLDQDAFSVTLVVDAPAELTGAPCMILQGDQPFEGNAVGGLILHAGPNLTWAPQGGGSWVTATGPGFKPRSGQLGDVPFEE